MSFIKAIDISASGLYAQKTRIEIVAQNMANADTIQTNNNQPYSKKTVLLTEVKDSKNFSNILDDFSNPKVGAGVKVAAVVEGEEPYKMVYDPDHPLADEEGYVKMPNVNTTDEMLELMAASRAYEANAAVIEASKSIFAKSLEIIKK